MAHGSRLKAQGSALGVEVRDEAIGTLPLHAQIPIAFTVERVIDIEDAHEPPTQLLDGRTDLALLWDIRVRPE